MTTLITTASVAVDTTSIAVEISIDSESNLEGTVGSKLGHHVVLTNDRVGLGTLTLVSVPIKSSVASATLLALRGVHASIITSSVRIALIRNNTSLDPVDPSATGLSTIAVTAARIARSRAAVDILSRETDVLTLEDTLTIAHGLSGTESPARTTVLLVADIRHGRAAWPVVTRIEFIGSIHLLSSRVFLDPPGVSVELLEVNTKKTTSLALGHTGDGVMRSLPGGLLLIDLTDHAGADSDFLSKDGCSDKGNNKDNLVHFI